MIYAFAFPLNDYVKLTKSNQLQWSLLRQVKGVIAPDL